MNKRDEMLREAHMWTRFHHLGWDTLMIANLMRIPEAKVYNTLARMREERAKVAA